ncbi:predicted permease [Parvularcula bermudensis HTCC2503]|uniref:Predicted permease n=1 Tax=Parvularcula bermudensis (strain ATCC BAA-594 / HTCC2503 / KCTC 12087) TaxID=314260 RepID=E0TCF8_PARBH|nr:LptF/LptG family permease [Parvularcula bermudensis]ADM09848.1 predicted permease [Parvularcula bermudensis HTCC2503]
MTVTFGYLAKRTLGGVLGLLLVIWLIVVSVDLIEAMRDIARIPGAGPIAALRLTLLRTPQLILSLSPFIFLFGTLWAYGQMARMSEIAVLRAAGLSVWRLIFPPVILAVAAGLLIATTLDPLAARLAETAQTVKNEARSGEEAAAKRPHLWLRQNEIGSDGIALLHAERYRENDPVLEEVTVWRRTQDGAFIERLDAPRALIDAQVLRLMQARRSTSIATTAPQIEAEIEVPVAIDLRLLDQDRQTADTLSVWALPETIRLMGDAGMTTTKFRLRYHALWSLPLKLAAMVILACAFALGMNARGGGTALLMGMGILAGFLLFILSELSAAIAEAAIVPVGLAAWAPALLAVLFAVTLLLYREDG